MGEAPPPELENLPPSQFLCLVMVGRNPGCKMADIARMMKITLPALSQVVTRLVRRGMILRREDPEDRRIVNLELTPQAETLLQKHFERKRARVQAMWKQLQPGDREKALEGLHLLAEAALRADAERSPQEPGTDGNPIVVKLPGAQY